MYMAYIQSFDHTVLSILAGTSNVIHADNNANFHRKEQIYHGDEITF